MTRGARTGYAPGMGLRDFAAIVELRTKTVSLTSFGLGTLTATFAHGRFCLPAALLGLAAVLCVDMGTTAFNTFFDYERRVDDKRTNREEDKILVHRGVAPGWALIAGLALFAAAGVLGLALAFVRGAVVVLVGAAGMAVGLLYNFGPRPISRTPFGELAAGGFLGAILFAFAYYLQARRVTPAAWISSLPLFLLVASILTVNNTCDIEGDRAAGRRTLSIVVGRAWGEVLIYGCGGLAYAVTAFQIVKGVLPRVAAAAAAAALAWTVAAYVRMHRRGYSHATKAASMRAIVGVLAAYGLALGSALAFAIARR